MTSRSLKIAMLLEIPFPPDARVEKEACALVRAGHEVHVLAVTFSGEETPVFRDEIHIHRLPVREYWFKKWRASVLRFPAYGRIWMRYFIRLHEMHHFDIIHIHDLPLAKTGYRLACRYGIPWVLDLHENYPAFLESAGLTRGPAGRFFFHPGMWRRYEHWSASRADRVILVVREARQRFREAGMDMSRFSVVSNTVRPELFQPGKSSVHTDHPLTLLYLGGFNPHRGLETTIRAMPVLLQSIPDARLVLVGDGRIRPSLEALAEEQGVKRAVEFRGSVPFHQVREMIAESDVCLVPHESTEHTNTTIPHKLFQYMAMGKAVLVSDCLPLKRIVTDTGAGSVFHAGDPVSLAGTAVRMSDPEVRRQYGKRGQSAVRKTYHWDRDARELTGIYQRLSEKMVRTR